MNARAQYHNDTGRDFLASARTHLAADDLLQASEKGWGAAAQMVKCAAEDRGWIHNGHRQLYLTIDRLADETGDPQLRDLFDHGQRPPRQLLRWLDAPQDGRVEPWPCG